MYSRDEKRIVSFNPCARHIAKNTCEFKNNVEIGDFNKVPMDFLSHVIVQCRESQAKVEQIRVTYDELLTIIAEKIGQIQDTETANEISKEIAVLEEIWDSRMLSRVKLRERTAELGLKFNKDLKVFEAEGGDK
jgi:hypothetical protein